MRLCSWSLASSILSLASRGSVLGKAVLGFGLGFFFCVLGLGLEPCVLDSTSAVQHKIVLAKLNQYGIRGVVNNFFESYLTNRSQAVIIHDNHSSKFIIDIGVPQGSSLGPLLFLLYINDLHNCISSASRLFADDTCILIQAYTSNELKYSLNYELAKINGWIVANKLALNAAKFSVIIIKPKLHSSPVEMNLSCAAGSIEVISSRGGVEDTRLEAKAKDTKKNPRPKPRTAFLRTDPLEAKDRMLEAKDQEHSRKCSPKKRSSKKFFRQSPIYRRRQNF